MKRHRFIVDVNRNKNVHCDEKTHECNYKI